MTDEPPFNTKSITLADLDSAEPWWAEHIDAPAPHRRRPRQPDMFFDIQVAQELKRGSDVEMARVVQFEANTAYGRLIFAEGDFWVFEDTMWRRVPENMMRTVVHKFDGATAASKEIKIKSSTVTGVIRETIALTAEPEFFSEPSLGLNVRNGVVLIDANGKISMRQHEPDDRHRFTIDADYAPSAIPPSSMLARLTDGAFKDDQDKRQKVDLIGELLGAAAYGLATRLPQPKACIFLGETASNGKSTIASLISVLLPPGAVSSIPLAAFSDEKRIVNLAGKAANVADELSGQAIQGEQFKAAVTGDPLEGRDLYKSAMTFRPRALQVCTTNVLPVFNGGIDRGLQRRLIVLPFTRTIPDDEIIADIADRIRRDELALLLQFAVQGAQRLIINGGYTIPPSADAALKEWLMKDPVVGWFSERFDAVDDYQSTEWTPIRTLYDNFKAWCSKEDIAEKYLPSRENFSIRLCRQRGVHKRRISTGAEVRGIVRKPTQAFDY